MAPQQDPSQDTTAQEGNQSPRDWYSSSVWGKQQQDDDALFEVMSLQVFQAGLTWNMVLQRRDAFRNAFRDWNIDAVAGMGPEDVQQLIADPSIIRNRKKIEACVANARTVQALRGEYGSFCNWFYNVLPEDDLAGLQGALRKTFKFMGPEIARMWLLASGRLPDGRQGD